MTTDTCIHAWEIEPAYGTYSPGECRLCGETKFFKNSIGTLDEEANWKQKGAKSKAARKEQAEMAEARRQHDIDTIGMPY